MEKETNTKMPFHLTITDNETGEALRDFDFDAILGAVHLSDEEAAGIYITRCKGLAVAETYAAAKRIMQRAEKIDPALVLMQTLLNLKPETEESTNE